MITFMRNIHTDKLIFFWYFEQVLQLAARSHLRISMSDANIRFSFSAFSFCHEIYNFIREKSILRGMRFSVRLFIAMSRFVRPSVRRLCRLLQFQTSRPDKSFPAFSGLPIHPGSCLIVFE